MMNETKNHPTIVKLNALCQSMAQDLNAYFSESGMEEYHRFLNMMYHYTLQSGDRLKFASENAVHPKLKLVFAELATEEQYHYRLAQADLHSMGKQPSSESPPQPIAFHDYWMSITPTNQFEYVGAMYVLENIATHIKPYLMPHFSRLGLEPGQAKFIMTHLVADEDHGERLQALSEEAHGKEIEQVFKGAERAQKFWLDIHIASLVSMS